MRPHTAMGPQPTGAVAAFEFEGAGERSPLIDSAHACIPYGDALASAAVLPFGLP